MSLNDERHLRRALELARAGIGLASPNPHVGAVITDADGNLAGEATYTYADVKHAEILALEQAGARARGGTLYINLEPHAHQGRTAPCTEALITAGIRRVVASMPDPNPKVSGRGFEQLRSCGVQVDVGAAEPEARRLNEAFARYIQSGLPLVVLKSAMSLDGKIAPAVKPGSATTGFRGHWMTGEQARAHVHELRHQNDAILVGIGTVLADDPLLTDRSGKARRRPLLRVVLDSQLRLPIKARLVQEERESVAVFHVSGNDRQKSELEKSGIRVHKVSPDQNGRVDLQAVMRCLGKMEITSVMIEGGSAVNGAALAAGVIDKVFLYYAPKLLGEGVPFARGGRPACARNIRVHRFGEDIALEGYIRDPYGA
jgi:diaminohydroxyphosphoribosylaminopyrimidine deaminase/5-amino-6-(5-phosphoribosylamino)uracil reductase